MNKGQH